MKMFPTPMVVCVVYPSIPAEAFKTDIEASVELLYPLFKKIWENEQVPSEWKGGYLFKLTNEDDASSYSNFTFHLSPRSCPSTAGCSPPSMPSIVLCLLLSCSRWCPPSLPSSIWLSPRSLSVLRTEISDVFIHI